MAISTYFRLAVKYDASKTLSFQVRQWDVTTSTAGNYWNNGGSAWQSGVPTAISMTEQTQLGCYLYGRGTAMGTYTGAVAVFVYDSTITNPIGFEVFQMISGRLRPMEEVTSDLHYDWTNGQRLDTILDTAAAGGIALNISPYIVLPNRTWSIEPNSDAARQVVRVPEGSSVTLAMDFSKVINHGAALYSITSVTDTTGAITPSSSAISQNKMCAHFTVTGLVSGETYTIETVVVTTDGDTLVGKGTLKVL